MSHKLNIFVNLVLIGVLALFTSGCAEAHMIEGQVLPLAEGTAKLVITDALAGKPGTALWSDGNNLIFAKAIMYNGQAAWAWICGSNDALFCQTVKAGVQNIVSAAGGKGNIAPTSTFVSLKNFFEKNLGFIGGTAPVWRQLGLTITTTAEQVSKMNLTPVLLPLSEEDLRMLGAPVD